MFVAHQMSGNKKYDWTKTGFLTYEDAEKYIYEHNCNTCKADIDRGFFHMYVFYDEHINELIVEEPTECHVMSTSCSAEWNIDTQENFRSFFKTQEEYDEYIKHLEEIQC